MLIWEDISTRSTPSAPTPVAAAVLCPRAHLADGIECSWAAGACEVCRARAEERSLRRLQHHAAGAVFL